MKIIVTREAIDPAAAYGLLPAEGAGSVVFHYAVVKAQEGQGGTTSGIEYGENGDVAAELEEIGKELKGNRHLNGVLLIRRIGSLGIGDIISLVAASSPNSEDAFGACRDGIAGMKKMKTIRKTETYG